MKKDYIIWCPPYSGSNGVRALYSLADYLISSGYNVSLYSWKPFQDKYNYVNKITKDMRQKAIVVYPEVVWGNPLGIKNVVRYVLFYPGKNGGSLSFHSSELIFTWLDYYYPGAHRIFFSGIDRKLFYDNQTPKRVNCYFVHKGGITRQIPEIEHAVKIDMSFPKSRNELADLLRKTDILYTFDKNTVIAEEALLCGAKVKVITENSIKDYVSTDKFSQQELDNELKIFVQLTQNMDYQGKIEGRYWKRFLSYQIAKNFYKFLKFMTGNQKYKSKALLYRELLLTV